jgi:hypothetical protein
MYKFSRTKILSGSSLCEEHGGLCYISEEGDVYPCSKHCADCLHAPSSKCENHTDDTDDKEAKKDTDGIGGVKLKPFLSTDIFKKDGDDNIFKLGQCLKCVDNWMVKEGKKTSCMNCHACNPDENVYCTIHESCDKQRELIDWRA